MSRTINIDKQHRLRSVRPNSVFVSYRFLDTELVGKFLRLLKIAGFEVRTGNSANTSISEAILDSIEISSLFVCILTRHEQTTENTWTSSAWLHQELGAAMGFRKRHFVLMVENGITDIGGIQGDWQQIKFTRDTFFEAALNAVEQLQSYLKKRPEPIVQHA